jgi:hypothetical protein
MAYSLNPKDLREELQTYKRPVYVASTQPAQQKAAPASTSGYRMQKRADGGTDFYKGNQKTTIEEFSKGTGNRVEAVRGNLAAGGSKFDQDILARQYFETKDPEVSKFNKSDVLQQRGRVAELQGLAGRTQFNSQEDIKNRDWARQQLANIEIYGKKQGGNPLTFAQDMVASAVSPYKRLGEGWAEVLGSSAQQQADQDVQANSEETLKTVQILSQKMSQATDPRDKERYRQAISNIMKLDDVQTAQQQAQQGETAERTDPVKAAGAAASVGLDIITAGAGGKLINAALKGSAGAAPTVGSKLINFTNTVINPQTIKQGVQSGATLGLGYGTASTAEQMGADATLEDYAKNAATSSLIGAALGGAIPATISGVKAAGKGLGIKTPTARATDLMNVDVKAEQSARQLSDELAAGDPTLQAALKKVQDNEAKIYQLQSGGMSDNAPDIVKLRNEAAQAENFAQNRFRTLSDEQYTKNLELERARLKTEQRASERAEGRQELQDVNKQLREFVPGGTLDAPLGKKTAFESDLEAAGLKPTAKSKFARTVQRSEEVSDPLKAKVKESEPRYDVTTDEARIAQSESYLKSQGLGKATTDIKQRLVADKIDDQTASDAIAVAKRLDARSTTKSLQEATEIYEQLAEKFSKAGQLVQAASLLGNRTPEGLRFSAIKSLKKEGVKITPEMTKKIDGFIQQVKKTPAGSYENGLARDRLMKYIGKQLPQRKMSQILQVWKAGLLTSPRTTAGNLAANTAETILRKGYVDPLANMLDAVASLFTGQRSRKYTLRGMVSGTGGGIVKGIKYFKTGYDPRNPSQKFDVRNIYYSDKPLGKAAEIYTQAVFRLMGAQDQPFYYSALRNSLYDQALTEASRQKLSGSAKSDFIKQFVSEPQTKAMDLADKEARYAVFQNETQLGRMASRLKNTEGAGGDIAEFLIPFSGVPSSIATRMIERTPIGWATEIVKQIKNKSFDQRAMTQAIANGSMAVPLIGAGSALANAGLMTLGYPTEKKERDLWEAEGKQPYSIKVGDQWLSLNYFQPAGNLIAAGAEYQNAINEGEDPETAFTNALAGSGKAFTEQSFLKGVSGGINALTDPQRSAEKFAEQTAGSIVPNFIRTAARATDPVQREMNGVVDAVTAGIPGARQTLPAKTNIYGEDVPRRGSMLDEIVNPFKPSKDLTAENRMTAALRELQDRSEGITPTQVTKSTFKDESGKSLLDDKQILEVNKRVAKEVSIEWKKVMEDPRYEKLSDADKRRLLDRVNDSVYGAVKSEYGDTKLTKLQQLYKKGADMDYFANFEVTSDGLSGTKLPSDTLASSFLLDASAVDSLDKAKWSQSEVSKEYQPMIDEFNKKLPKGLPKLPYTNATAELIADFQKAKADSNWSNLELNNRTKDLAINTYKAQLTDNERFITTLSDADILAAAEDGQVSREELDRIIAVDNTIRKLGAYQIIGNKTRRLLGYGELSSGSGSGGRGRKKNYKLNAFGNVSGSVSGNLRKLIEEATVKGV